MKAINNCKLIAKDGILENMAVIFDEKIIDIVPESSMSGYRPGEVIDGKGNYLSPGFIDIHIHGCFGEDVMDAGEDTLYNISRTVAGTGVTAFLATTMTMDMDRIRKALHNIRNSIGKTEGAEILGCHLEGPFISRIFKGAQDEKYIVNPRFSEIEEFKDIIKIITLAPENEGSIEFIKECKKHGILVSIGHSNASYEEAMEAINAGAGHITHTYNAMTPLHHRNPGIVGAAMLSDASCELIVDNVHVHPAAQKILLKMKGNDKVILITDAMRACLMEEGLYDLGGQKVTVRNNEARLSNGALAGSVLTIDRAIRNFIHNHGIALQEVVRMVSLNPAAAIGIDDKKGSIEKGKDADMVLFNEGIEVCETIVKGKTVHRRY